MRAGAGLGLLSAGAILTFAVGAPVPGINFRVAGVIVILTGIVVLVAPQAAAWLRQRRGAADRPGGVAPSGGITGDGDGQAAFFLQDPAVLAAEVLSSARAARRRDAGGWPDDRDADDDEQDGRGDHRGGPGGVAGPRGPGGSGDRPEYGGQVTRLRPGGPRRPESRGWDQPGTRDG